MGHSDLGLIVNATARGVKRHHLVARPFWHNLLPAECVRVTRNLEDLDLAIAAFQKAGVRVVATLGGDGSLHRLVDKLLHRYEESIAPIVLSLAGGTMNGLPRALGTGGHPKRVLEKTILALARGESPPVRMRYLLRITDVTDGHVHFGFGFATGLVFRAFQEYYRDPEPGLIDALRATALPLKSAIFGGTFYDGLNLVVNVDGAPWLPTPPHTLAASVIDNPFLWFRPFGAPLGDARAFHMAALAMRPREIARRLWSILRGNCRQPGLRVGQVSEATVHGETGYLIDGDLYCPRGVIDLRLTIGPGLRFVCQAPPMPVPVMSVRFLDPGTPG